MPNRRIHSLWYIHYRWDLRNISCIKWCQDTKCVIEPFFREPTFPWREKKGRRSHFLMLLSILKKKSWLSDPFSWRLFRVRAGLFSRSWKLTNYPWHKCSSPKLTCLHKMMAGETGFFNGWQNLTRQSGSTYNQLLLKDKIKPYFDWYFVHQSIWQLRALALLYSFTPNRYNPQSYEYSVRSSRGQKYRFAHYCTPMKLDSKVTYCLSKLKRIQFKKTRQR